VLHQPVSPSTSHDSETTDSVPDILNIGKGAQSGVSVALRACDMKVFSVAYVSSFIAKRLLKIVIVTYAKLTDI